MESECRSELRAIEEELAQIVCDEKSQIVRKEGLQSTKDFVCDGKYSDDLLNICRDRINCYEGGHDGYEKRRKGRRKYRQTADKD